MNCRVKHRYSLQIIPQNNIASGMRGAALNDSQPM
jgi:hypothetical protein